jgi:predicted HTH domain antitoxin
MDPMDVDEDGVEILQFKIEDLKKELREEKIKYNNLVDAVFEKVLTKKTITKN